MDTADLIELLEGLPFPAFVVGEQERIITANPLSQMILGPKALGRQLVIALRAPILLDAIADVAREGVRKEVLLRTPDDSQYRATVSPLSQGRILCVLRDMTSEMKSEEIRRDFVANVSHELRTPLTAVMGFIETLRTTAREDAVARERFLEIMDREANRMHRLVRDLLQLSRVEAQERIAPKDEVDLSFVLKGIEASTRPSADEKGTKVILIGAEQPQMVRGDGDQLTQVFTNLIENALKYGALKSTVTVTLERDERDKLAHVSVRDQGEGIDAIHLPRLTERFYRVDRHRSRNEGGTGLGLAIVKHIVNRHRGRLKVESVKGEGSVFRVSLPLA